MGIIDPEKVIEFKCAICGTDCVKVDPREPDIGYISSVDESFVGPICDNCQEEQRKSKRELVLRKTPEAAFLVVIKPDGEGIFVTEEGISIDYMRHPTTYEVVSACNQVVEDMNSAIASKRTVAVLMRTLSMQQSRPTPRLMIPQ